MSSGPAVDRLRGMHGCKTLGRLAQGWFEIANAQPGERGLYPVHNARAFPHQAVALPVRPLGVLFGNPWHARHATVPPFSTQPPQEPALLDTYGDLYGSKIVEPATTDPNTRCNQIYPHFRSVRSCGSARLPTNKSSRVTLRWRGVDSNSRSHPKKSLGRAK